MNIIIRQVKESDLENIIAVEESGFPPNEAAPRESFIYRIASYPGSFLVAECDGELVGIINGCVTNDMAFTDKLFTPQGHESDGRTQTILGVAVLPQYRGRGIAAKLIAEFADRARAANRQYMILTCKKSLVAFYEKLGFKNMGLSQSVHGGVEWYDIQMAL